MEMNLFLIHFPTFVELCLFCVIAKYTTNPMNEIHNSIAYNRRVTIVSKGISVADWNNIILPGFQTMRN
jgi:hypothetical protein